MSANNVLAINYNYMKTRLSRKNCLRPSGMYLNPGLHISHKDMFEDMFFKLYRRIDQYIFVVITNIDFSQEMFAIDMLRA